MACRREAVFGFAGNLPKMRQGEIFLLGFLFLFFFFVIIIKKRKIETRVKEKRSVSKKKIKEIKLRTPFFWVF